MAEGMGQSFLLLASRCLLLADHQTKTSSQWRAFLNVESACGGQASIVEL